MKNRSFFASATALFLLVIGLGAEELKPVFWSRGACVPERFTAHTSGTMTISADKEDKNAVRFEVEFPSGTDRWVYPKFALQGHESLADVDEIRFDIKARQGNPDAGYRHAYVMFGQGIPYYAIPTPSTEYRTITVKIADALKNPAAAREIQIGVNPRDQKLTYSIRNLQFLSRRSGSLKLNAADVVKAAAPGAAFLQGEALKFDLEPFAAVPTKWELRDWNEKTLRQGEWPESGTKPLELAALPNGFYLLTLASDEVNFSGSRSFAVVADPTDRPKNPDLYFALDSAQSWLARPNAKNSRQPKNAYEITSEVAWRSGLQMLRERLSWGGTEVAPGKYDWKQYKTNADLLAARDIEILGMYHDTTVWAKTNTPILPGDMLATYHYAKTIVGAFRNQMTVWEFWNEQDGSFAPESAWDYASAMKAAYLGFKAADPAMPVTIGGLASTKITQYDEIMMQCGLEEYFDIFNIHTYNPIKHFPELMAGIDDYLERYGVADKPIWFTENGSRLEGFGREDSHVPNLKRHSFEQELMMAEYLQKSMITLQVLGVARDFFFVLPPYNENDGKKDWGMMRRDFTVKPGFAAFSTLVDQFGTATAVGEVDLGEGLVGYLYLQKNGSYSLIYWSRSALDDTEVTDFKNPNLTLAERNEITFALPFSKQLTGVDLFGTPFATDSKNITANRFPRILNDVEKLTVTKPAKTPGKLHLHKNSEFDKSIVFRTEFLRGINLLAGKSKAEAKLGGCFQLQIWNLSDQAKTGTVALSGVAVSGLPETIDLPAFGKVELELTLTDSGTLDNEYNGQMRIDGIFDGRKATHHVIPLQFLEKLTESARSESRPRMLDPVRWRANAAGKSKMEITRNDSEQSIRFRTKFDPAVSDRWTYPEYLLDLPQESLKDAIGIGFEVKASNPDAVKQMYAMAVKGAEKETGETILLPAGKPAKEWEARLVMLPGDLDPAEVKQLRFGVNSGSSDITLELRNIRIYYAN